MRLFVTAALPVLLTCPVFGQAPAQSRTHPEFEVASIRPSASDIDRTQKVSIGVQIDGSQVRFSSLTLREYLARAYSTKAPMISGPDWTGSERFDLSATLPAGSTQAQIPEMLQALLTERFHVKLHRDKKEFPVYALLTGKNPVKLKESPPDSGADLDEPKGAVNVAAAGSAAGVGVNLGHGSSYSLANSRFEAHKLTMAVFAAQLERFADRPIVDMTGLTARYDFAVDLTQEDYQAMLIRAALQAGMTLPPEVQRILAGNSSGSGLSDALQQVGLRLDARKAPIDVIVIDDALKTPTDN
jgi:uncharacterized protein (TIGR03435 family)